MLIKDTHKAIKSLKEAGLPPEQAERIVGLFQEADEQAATGHDIDLLRKDIEALRKEMDVLRKDLTIKVYTVGLAIAGLMAALELL